MLDQVGPEGKQSAVLIDREVKERKGYCRVVHNNFLYEVFYH